MTSISVSSETKGNFDELKPDNLTHDEFINTLLETYQAYNGELIDPEEQAELTAEKMGPKLELALYRVADELGEE